MRRSRFRWQAWAGLAATAALAGVYAGGGLAWVLGFVVLVPWLLALESCITLRASVRSGWVMAVAFVAAVFGWFGVAIGGYTGIGAAPGVIALLVLAPFLQPQFIAFAVVRYWVGRNRGPWMRAIAAASAWIGCEWLVPRLFGDSLGHGLYPSALLRQFADVGGVAGITFLLIFLNECIAMAITRRREGVRSVATPLIAGVVILALMSGYGALRLSSVQASAASDGMPLRIGMVQSNIYDYERLRREIGAYEVVRHVLDTHFAMSRELVARDGVDALLWSETVYPTTFGHPKSEDGAALDREIQDFVASTGLPLVFGTYDLDDQGEYNAAAFVDARGETLGVYRKSKLFPLTEFVPQWIDGQLLRRALPWAGSWQPGDGARVFPLRMRDGREIPVVPLICRDDVDSGLALDGTRLGAQLIIGMSNDSWFTDHPVGMRLHSAVAAFRSIETRLPQVRVTANGISAVIDTTGTATTFAPMGEAALLVGEVSVREPPRTLLVAWGDWVGRTGLAFLVLLGLVHGWSTWRSRHRSALGANKASSSNGAYRAHVLVLTPFWRASIVMFKLLARASLVWMGLVWLFGDGSRLTSVSGIKMFLALVAAPELFAWCLARVFCATAFIGSDALVLEQRRQRIEIPLRSITRLRAWRVALPSPGAWIELANGKQWPRGIAVADLPSLRKALVHAGAARALAATDGERRLAAHVRLGAMAPRTWLDRGIVKFVLFPLVPALVAFRLHQHIAFGGTFGEFQTYGLKAYLLALAIWWASWAMGLAIFAAALRALTEVLAMVALAWRPAHARDARHLLETAARLLFYVGVPAWWVLRVWAG